MADLNLDSLEINGKFRGRAKKVRSHLISGRYVKAAPVQENEHSFALAADATIRSAILRQGEKGVGMEKLAISSADLHKKIYQRHIRSLIIFVVDVSESMGEDGAQARIRAAKGAILGILTKAYQKRFRVGLVSFCDESAEIVLQPTSSLPLAQKCLTALPVGGATPFAHGLMKGWQMIKTERRKDPDIRPLMVVLSDGEANVAFDGKLPQSKIIDELLSIGALISRDQVSSLIIETRSLRDPSGTMRGLAEAMGGSYYHSTTFKSGDLLQVVAAF
ncbi:MAG: VWA domain-containing protein [Desulfofustis sp.]|nr:VWA domain-containing protein [Desulfofustis sp.]